MKKGFMVVYGVVKLGMRPGNFETTLDPFLFLLPTLLLY